MSSTNKATLRVASNIQESKDDGGNDDCGGERDYCSDVDADTMVDDSTALLECSRVSYRWLVYRRGDDIVRVPLCDDMPEPTVLTLHVLSTPLLEVGDDSVKVVIWSESAVPMCDDKLGPLLS